MNGRFTFDGPTSNNFSELAEAEEMKSPGNKKVKAPETRESGKKLARLGGSSTGLADYVKRRRF